MGWIGYASDLDIRATRQQGKQQDLQGANTLGDTTIETCDSRSNFLESCQLMHSFQSGICFKVARYFQGVSVD